MPPSEWRKWPCTAPVSRLFPREKIESRYFFHAFTFWYLTSIYQSLGSPKTSACHFLSNKLLLYRTGRFHACILLVQIGCWSIPRPRLAHVSFRCLPDARTTSVVYSMITGSSRSDFLYARQELWERCTYPTSRQVRASRDRHIDVRGQLNAVTDLLPNSFMRGLLWVSDSAFDALLMRRIESLLQNASSHRLNRLVANFQTGKTAP